MTIELDHILPHPLREARDRGASQIWEQTTSFATGQRYLVTAPSGKGKSTLLHIIYGLRTDYGGEVRIDGKPVAHYSMDGWSDLRREHLSIVFQDLRLFGHLTARENIEIKRQLAPRISAETAEQMAGQLGIDDVYDQPAATLSYGQRQRVAIIRALCQPFGLLLLDEPFSHLDDDNIARARALIEEACTDQDAGFLLVSLGSDYAFSPTQYLNL